MNNKAIVEDTKNSADLGRCYPPRPSASVDNTLLDMQNSSYSTQPHSIIPKSDRSFLCIRIIVIIFQYIVKVICEIYILIAHDLHQGYICN